MDFKVRLGHIQEVPLVLPPKREKLKKDATDEQKEQYEKQFALWTELHNVLGDIVIGVQHPTRKKLLEHTSSLDNASRKLELDLGRQPTGAELIVATEDIKINFLRDVLLKVKGMTFNDEPGQAVLDRDPQLFFETIGSEGLFDLFYQRVIGALTPSILQKKS